MKKAALVALVVVVIGFTFFWNNGNFRHEGIRRDHHEINWLSVALESYKDEHGTYPSDPLSTEQLKPKTSFDPGSYIKASQFLYRALSGGEIQGADGKNAAERRVYLEFPRQMLRAGEPGGTYIADPWGNSYGYSTFKSVHPESLDGYNPTFDLWTTAGGKREKDQARWTKNW